MSLILSLVLLAQLTPSGSGITPMAFTHPTSFRLHLNDDILASFGNTAAAPDFWCEHDTSTTPDEWACTSTDIDGVGTNGVVFRVPDGTDNPTLTLTGRLVLDGGSAGGADSNDHLSCTSNDNCRLTVGNAAVIQATSTAVTFVASAGVTGAVRFASTTSTLTLDAATTIAVVRNTHILDCVGAETLTTITGGISGAILVLKFLDADVCTITDDDTGTANTIDISAAYLSTARDTLTLFFDGTSWVEVGRSVN